MDEVEAGELLQARVALFEREIALLDDHASWANHRDAIVRAINADLTLPTDA